MKNHWIEKRKQQEQIKDDWGYYQFSVGISDGVHPNLINMPVLITGSTVPWTSITVSYCHGQFQATVDGVIFEEGAGGPLRQIVDGVTMKDVGVATEIPVSRAEQSMAEWRLTTSEAEAVKKMLSDGSARPKMKICSLQEYQQCL